MNLAVLIISWLTLRLTVNHIFVPNPSDPGTSGPQQPPATVSGGAGSSIPITAPEALPFVLDVQEDPLTSAPTTPDFRDAIDAFL